MYTKITKVINIIMIILILVFSINLISNITPTIYNDPNLLKNRVEKIDEHEFINYMKPNKDMKYNSNELIAVEFNNIEGPNVGLIDINGNVVVEPLISSFWSPECDEDYESTDSLPVFYNNTVEIEERFYNERLEEVHLTTKEIKERNETIENMAKKLEDVTIIEKRRLENKILSDMWLPATYLKNNDINIITNGEFYSVSLIINNVTHNYIYNSSFERVENLKSVGDGNTLQLSKYGFNSGSTRLTDIGTVYYNASGKIIWISYCKYDTPRW